MELSTYSMIVTIATQKRYGRLQTISEASYFSYYILLYLSSKILSHIKYPCFDIIQFISNFRPKHVLGRRDERIDGWN